MREQWQMWEKGIASESVAEMISKFEQLPAEEASIFKLIIHSTVNTTFVTAVGYKDAAVTVSHFSRCGNITRREYRWRRGVFVNLREPNLGGRVSVEASRCRRVALVGHNFVQIVTP